ncbi:MAG: deoxynucleoside kinase [Bacteroidota bacterium]
MYLVAVSGNTGVGKSSFIKRLATILKTNHAVDAICVDERLFHHERLINMFNNPSEWSYIIQYNFLIQRAAWVKAHEGEKLVLMERSILEDLLFVKYYYRNKHISKELYQNYLSLHDYIRNDVPSPNLIIHLICKPENSIKRIEKAYNEGERIVEIEGENLRDYVHQMNGIYMEWSEDMRNSHKLVSLQTDKNVDNINSLAELIAEYHVTEQ